MIRVVRANDRRTWTVRSSINWTGQALADEFECDVTNNRHGVGVLLALFALTLVVVFWTPADVVRPAWFVLLFLLFLLMVPVFWALQRPWVITAYTAEPSGTDGEHWEGVVGGMLPARDETHRVIEDLKTKGSPEDGTGALVRVTSTAPFSDM